MTRAETQIMKGVAILSMLFYHLFDWISNAEICHNLIYIDGTPLVHILSKATNPVPFFLILGGYGLYKVNEQGDKHRWSRVLKLYIHYWMTLLIFVTIGHFMIPDKYPGTTSTIVSNLTSFHTTYNGEMWFLFPYVALSLLAPYIFKAMKHFKSIHIVLGTLFIYLCTSYCISRHGKSFLFTNYWIYNPLLVFHLLFNFSLGTVAAREKFFKKAKCKVRDIRHANYSRWLLIIILIAINCVFKYNFFYAFLIITLLVMAPLPKPVGVILAKFGGQSMNIWMIHSWFCYYLFHNFIYSFKYPLLIFIVLTTISYCCSLLLNLITKPIELRFMARFSADAKPVFQIANKSN